MVTCSQVPRNIAGLYSDFWVVVPVRIAGHVMHFTIVTKEIKTMKFFFFLIVIKNPKWVCRKKFAIEMKKFWRVVSVNHFRDIHAWEESAGSQPAQQEKDSNENARWAQNCKSLRNLLGLCTWWAIWGAIWSSGSFSPFHNIWALCLQSCCEVKQSNRQGQIVMRMSLSRPHLQANWSGHRWRLKPSTAPRQLGTSGGVAESRR